MTHKRRSSIKTRKIPRGFLPLQTHENKTTKRMSRGGEKRKLKTIYIDHKRCTKYDLYGHMKKKIDSEIRSFSLNKKQQRLPFNHSSFTSSQNKEHKNNNHPLKKNSFS